MIASKSLFISICVTIIIVMSSLFFQQIVFTMCNLRLFCWVKLDCFHNVKPLLSQFVTGTDCFCYMEYWLSLLLKTLIAFVCYLRYEILITSAIWNLCCLCYMGLGCLCFVFACFRNIVSLYLPLWNLGCLYYVRLLSLQQVTSNMWDLVAPIFY